MRWEVVKALKELKNGEPASLDGIGVFFKGEATIKGLRRLRNVPG